MTSVTGEKEVQIGQFVSGCLGMRGVASSMELHALSFEVKTMRMRQHDFSDKWVAKMSQITAVLEGLKETVTAQKLVHDRTEPLPPVTELQMVGSRAMASVSQDIGMFGATIRNALHMNTNGAPASRQLMDNGVF